MKALHVIPSLSPKHGGPSFAVDLIARGLLRTGVEVDLATTDDDGPGSRLDVPLGQRMKHGGYGIYYFRKQTEFYKVSLPFSRWAARHISDYDVVCVHAVFSYTSTSSAYWSRRLGVPYVVIPHGVLNRWGVQHRRPLLKWFSLRLVERRLLRHASAMYYTSSAEKREAEEAGASARAVVIPHGIDADDFRNLPDPEIFLRRFPQARGRTVILFLSRLDSKKGLDLLLPLFEQTKRKHPSAMLVLAGSGQSDYVASLKTQAQVLGIGDDLVWTGFLEGTDKLAVFAAAKVFILPSYSENFGIALVEAMAAGLPCLTTYGVALWEDIRENDAGIIAPAEVQPLVEALDRLLSEASLRLRLGENARRLVAKKFTIPAMGTALRDLYLKVLSTRPPGR